MEVGETERNVRGIASLDARMLLSQSQSLDIAGMPGPKMSAVFFSNFMSAPKDEAMPINALMLL